MFDFSQLSFANGMRVEILEPTGDDPTNFLRRFLRQSGPGPHHLTYKVRSLDDAIAAAESMGYAWPTSRSPLPTSRRVSVCSVNSWPVRL